MNKLKIFYVVVFLVTSMATTSAWASWVYNSSTVKKYQPRNGWSIVTLKGAMINPAGCVQPAEYSMNADETEGYEDAKRTILTAVASGRRVGLYIRNDRCFANRPVIAIVFIANDD